MKKIFLFVAFIVLCGSFTIIKHHKTAQNDPSFEELLAQFPKETLPFTMSSNSLCDSSFRSSGRVIESKFGFFLPKFDNGSKFSRMPAPRAVAFRAIETPNMHILIYRIAASVVHHTYYAATFTKKGALINDVKFAQFSYRFITDATLDTNLNLICHRYEVIQEKNSEGYNTGKIIRLDSLSKTTVSLVQNGNEKPVILSKYAKF